MHRLIVQTYAYMGREVTDYRPLIIAFAIDNEPAGAVDLTKQGSTVPLELKIALASGSYLKYSINPEEAYKTLALFMSFEGRPFRSHWFPMRRLLTWLGFPDELYFAMRLIGKTVPAVMDEKGCIERFCRPDPVFGKKTEPDEFPYQWDSFLRMALWQVKAMRCILDRYEKTLRAYINKHRYRRSFSFDRCPVDMDRVEELAEKNDQEIEECIRRHNRLVHADEIKTEEILENAHLLRKKLREDYSWIKMRIKDGYFENPREPESARYSWATMVFDTCALAEGEELIMLDYTRTLPEVAEWLKTDPKTNTKHEVFSDQLRIAIWQAMNTGEKIQCGRIRVVRKGNYLVLTIPSGNRLMLPEPVYSYNGKEWVLEYSRYREGHMERAGLVPAELIRPLSELALEAYMAVRAGFMAPREQMLFCEGERMLLKLKKGTRFMTDRPMEPHKLWLRKLSLSPKISYRTGGAYGE